MGTINADIETLTQRIIDNEGTFILDLATNANPREATRIYQTALHNMILDDEDDVLYDHVDMVSEPAPTPRGASATFELAGHLTEFLVDLVAKLESLGADGELLIPDPDPYPDIQDRYRTASRSGRHEFSSVRAVAYTISPDNPLPTGLLTRLVHMVRDTPNGRGAGSHYSGRISKFACSPHQVEEFFFINIGDSHHQEWRSTSIFWSDEARLRNLSSRGWHRVGFSDVFEIELKVDQLALARELIDIIVSDGDHNTLGGVFTRSDDGEARTLPPHTMSPRFAETFANYPLKIVTSQQAAQLPCSPDWERTPLDDGRVLLQPADLGAWFT
jgi:hypothetical protein